MVNKCAAGFAALLPRHYPDALVQVLPSLSDCISAMNKVQLLTKCSLSSLSGCQVTIMCKM